MAMEVLVMMMLQTNDNVARIVESYHKQNQIGVQTNFRPKLQLHTICIQSTRCFGRRRTLITKHVLCIYTMSGNELEITLHLGAGL